MPRQGDCENNRLVRTRAVVGRGRAAQQRAHVLRVILPPVRLSDLLRSVGERPEGPHSRMQRLDNQAVPGRLPAG